MKTETIPPHFSATLPLCCNSCSFLVMVPLGPIVIAPGCEYLVFDGHPRLIRMGMKQCKFNRGATEAATAGIVARTEIPRFTGGAIAVGTIANEESRGKGPEGSFKIGKKKCYSKEPLVDWIISRMEA